MFHFNFFFLLPFLFILVCKIKNFNISYVCTSSLTTTHFYYEYFTKKWSKKKLRNFLNNFFHVCLILFLKRIFYFLFLSFQCISMIFFVHFGKYEKWQVLFEYESFVLFTQFTHFNFFCFFHFILLFHPFNLLRFFSFFCMLIYTHILYACMQM